MPHPHHLGGGGNGGDDLASSDEIRVFKHEGDGDEDKQASENLTDLKSSLVTEGEEEKEADISGHSNNDYGSPKGSSVCRPDSGPIPVKAFEPLPPPSGHIGYVVSPYPHHHHHNGSLGAMGNKVPIPPHPGSPLPFMVYNGEHFAQPPPAHMGIPPVSVDPKTGIPRPPVYLGPPGQYPPVFNPDFTHQLQWHAPALYPTTSSGFRTAYSGALPVVTSASLPRFSPPTLLSPYPGISPHPGISHPALISTSPKQELQLHHAQNSHRSLSDYTEPKYHVAKSSNATNSMQHHHAHQHHQQQQQAKLDKKNHIKKPLNAFMLYMKEMRAKVVAECTLKESAAINQILGRRWHSLSREEQAKYYEMARKERQLHMQLYPGWSARDNYAQAVKKKKRKKDRSQDGDANNLKKCRARFGLDQQSSWCKPCRRKKKCIRYLDGSDNAGESEDNLGSTGSVEAPTPDSNKSGDDSDTNNSNPSPQFSLGLASPPEEHEMDRKPRLDSNGMIQEDKPKSHHHNNNNNHHHQHLLHHHPLSVHHLIQPHYSRSMKTEHCVIPQLPTPPSTDSSTTATAPPMLIVK